jgi:hypothetical protein
MNKLDDKMPEAYKDAVRKAVNESVEEAVEGISKIAEEAVGTMDLDAELKGVLERLAETGREFGKTWHSNGKDCSKE